MGVSFGKADIYRRALEKPNKKGNKELVDDFVQNGVQRGIENGIPKEAGERIQKAIIDNAGYLFNKSHSIAYSYISYWTAYIKANFPLVFYISLFNTEPVSKLQDCIQEAKKHGIKIEPPDMSKSKFESTIEDKENMVIRMGLNCVKGVGEKAVNEIVPNQPYTDFHDYFERAGKGAGKGVVEAGIKIGAFESIPLIVDKKLLKDNVLKTEENDDDTVKVYMNREQQLIWYQSYLDNKSKKSVPNYAIPKNFLSGEVQMKISDDVEQENIIIEKDDTIIVPENKLMDFELTVEQVQQYKTRKKPKGMFKVEKSTKKVVPEENAFSIVYNNIVKCHENRIKEYLDDIDAFELSFIPHPLEKYNRVIPILDKVDDGKQVRTAGIIVDIVKRQTKTGKPFYNVMIQTPREKQKITVWNNLYMNYKDILDVNSIVKVIGTKGFGGITAKELQAARTQMK